MTENGFKCQAPSSSDSAASVCTEICGDGMNILRKVNECDDGNVVDGDGCSGLCQVEAGWECF